MIVERSMHPTWLSNTYLVGDAPGGQAVLIDSGGPQEPVLAAIERHELTLTHVLCTHHHYDHVAHNGDYAARFGVPICGHGSERSLFGQLDHELVDGEEVRSGGLCIRALHVPGHTLGQLAFEVAGENAVFTGDTLFRRSVGGTRGPGHTTFADLQHSVLEVLMRLDPQTVIHPGHTEASTIGEEWEHNPFIRLWRGLDAVGEQACTAYGEAATLELSARDYDGGTKCQVRSAADGSVAVVPGSRVEIEGD